MTPSNPKPGEGHTPWTYYPALTASENHRGYWIQAGEGRKAFTVAQVMPLDEDDVAGEANAQLICEAVNQHARLLASNAEMREALEPFAKFVFQRGSAYANIDKHDVVLCGYSDNGKRTDIDIKMGDFLAARAALARHPEKEGV